MVQQTGKDPMELNAADADLALTYLPSAARALSRRCARAEGNSRLYVCQQQDGDENPGAADGPPVPVPVAPVPAVPEPAAQAPATARPQPLSGPLYSQPLCRKTARSPEARTTMTPTIAQKPWGDPDPGRTAKFMP